METRLKQLAIIGPTASGKSSLALELASEYGAAILSLDSLAVYREIDIASAKPAPKERKKIPHFGIDVVAPDETFSVMRFADLYSEASAWACQENRPLIIVGGSGFYLKVIIDGISPLPKISPRVTKKVKKRLLDLSEAYTELKKLDPDYSRQISPKDRYRIEKALCIAFETGIPPSQWFDANPPVSVADGQIPIYEIAIERATLLDRIARRTNAMLAEGLIDEVAALEHK